MENLAGKGKKKGGAGKIRETACLGSIIWDINYSLVGFVQVYVSKPQPPCFSNLLQEKHMKA